jgi:hypothetical protein
VSFSGNPFSIWFMVSLKRLPTPSRRVSGSLAKSEVGWEPSLSVAS